MDKTGWFQFGLHFFGHVQAYPLVIKTFSIAMFDYRRDNDLQSDPGIFSMGCRKVPTPCRVPDGIDASTSRQRLHGMGHARSALENSPFELQIYLRAAAPAADPGRRKNQTLMDMGTSTDTVGFVVVFTCSSQQLEAV